LPALSSLYTTPSPIRLLALHIQSGPRHRSRMEHGPSLSLRANQCRMRAVSRDPATRTPRHVTGNCAPHMRHALVARAARIPSNSRQPPPTRSDSVRCCSRPARERQPMERPLAPAATVWATCRAVPNHTPIVRPTCMLTASFSRTTQGGTRPPKQAGEGLVRARRVWDCVDGGWGSQRLRPTTVKTTVKTAMASVP